MNSNLLHQFFCPTSENSNHSDFCFAMISLLPVLDLRISVVRCNAYVWLITYQASYRCSVVILDYCSRIKKRSYFTEISYRHVPTFQNAIDVHHLELCFQTDIFLSPFSHSPIKCSLSVLSTFSYSFIDLFPVRHSALLRFSPIPIEQLQIILH